MKIIIDEDVLKKYDLTKSQFFYMMSLLYRITVKEEDILLNDKFYIDENNNTLFDFPTVLTRKGMDTLNKIFSDSPEENPERIYNLVSTLQSLFPTGKKNGTNSYWRGNSQEIKDRLLAFFKRFGNFDDDTIINATEKYVKSFEGNTELMRTLKYFISKKVEGNTVSDLLTIIENYDSNNSDILETTRLI